MAPVTLSQIAIEEKNKLGTDSVFLVALKITIPSISGPFSVRVVNNTETVVWKGESWTAFPFTINEISEATGEVPRVDIQVSNVSRVMDSYLEQYDQYIKAEGYTPITVNIYVINTAVIADNPNADPEVEHFFELKQPKADAMWATFTLGASNPYNRRFPQNRILKNHCRWKFKASDGLCGYVGVETACDHSLARCRELENSPRFGGAPGAGASGFEID
jgi:lambda family phage minor tail protein L